MTRYTRQDLLRILHLRTRQLLAWERAGLLPTFPADVQAYTFAHLAQARRLREIRASAGWRRLSLGSIRASFEAMEKVAGMSGKGTDDLWREAGVIPGLVQNVVESANGGRTGQSLNRSVNRSGIRTGQGAVFFRHRGALVNPITRQLAFDFDLLGTGEMMGSQLKVVNAAPMRTECNNRGASPAGRPFALPHPDHGGAGLPDGPALDAQVQEMFLRAVRLEENPTTTAEAAEIYGAILCMKPDHAPAAINLGTLFYNQREFTHAEGMYRRATEADPGYALAFFDLGNVLDEMQRLREAIEAYGRAIELLPGYADAHYNLALAYERQGERRRALRHWMTYVRLDPVGPWAQHARGQARKILSLERLSIVSRGGRSTVDAGRKALAFGA